MPTQDGLSPLAIVGLTTQVAGAALITLLFLLLQLLVWRPAVRERTGFLVGAFLAGYAAMKTSAGQVWLVRDDKDAPLGCHRTGVRPVTVMIE